MLGGALVLAGCSPAPDDRPATAATAATAATRRPPDPTPTAAGTPHPDAPAKRFLAGATAPSATLPGDIARGLSTDASVLDCAGGVVAGQSAFAPDWVVAHRLDLDDDGRDDWLVEGRHRCLAGADGADWWLYAEDAAGRRLLLATGRLQGVEVLPGRSHGFHDLRLARARGGDARARYDGAAYVAAPPD